MFVHLSVCVCLPVIFILCAWTFLLLSIFENSLIIAGKIGKFQTKACESVQFLMLKKEQMKSNLIVELKEKIIIIEKLTKFSDECHFYVLHGPSITFLYDKWHKAKTTYNDKIWIPKWVYRCINSNKSTVENCNLCIIFKTQCHVQHVNKTSNIFIYHHIITFYLKFL